MCGFKRLNSENVPFENDLDSQILSQFLSPRQDYVHIHFPFSFKTGF